MVMSARVFHGEAANGSKRKTSIIDLPANAVLVKSREGEPAQVCRQGGRTSELCRSITKTCLTREVPTIRLKHRAKMNM